MPHPYYQQITYQKHQNMKFLNTLLFVLFCLPLTLLAQKTENTDKRAMDDFNQVYIEGHFDVILHQGDQTGVYLDAKKSADLSLVKTSIKDEKLSIVYNHGNVVRNTPKIQLHLYYKDVSRIEIEGKIWLESNETLTAETLKIFGEGMIKGEIDVNIKKILVDMEGLIRLKINGKADVAKFNLEGMGRIDGKKLVAQKASTNVAGWAKTFIDVQQEYAANMEGIGSINFTGDPEKASINREGIVIVRDN